VKRWSWIVLLVMLVIGGPVAVARAAEGETSPAEEAELRALESYAGAVRPIMVRVLAMVRETGQKMAQQMETLPGPDAGMGGLVQSVMDETGAVYRLALFNALLERMSVLPVPVSAQTVHQMIMDGMYRARGALEAAAPAPDAAASQESVDAEVIARDVQTTFQRASSDLSDRLAKAAASPLPMTPSSSDGSMGLLDRLAAEPAPVPSQALTESSGMPGVASHLQAEAAAAQDAAQQSQSVAEQAREVAQQTEGAAQ